ncbi:maleylpyruvate isomerase N-terminal domain-containing protein [Streptomyces cellostaticus]|uniref:maleylpyruvate isomerase N-terminal domain-containing protein n=1 Tax=Streptomyces cellostaticus TaxID=67285 RepID=UPI000A753610|nr:hypothetical protein Scel_88160 [Streptomyces cellostaticus]
MRMDLVTIKAFNERAVRESIAVVRRVSLEDLTRPTPCSAWNLGELLAHMTAQHRGFAAAARADGDDLTHWKAEAPGPEAVARFLAAAEAVMTAFAEVGAEGSPRSGRDTGWLNLALCIRWAIVEAYRLPDACRCAPRFLRGGPHGAPSPRHVGGTAAWSCGA